MDLVNDKFVVASSVGEKESESETVPMNVDDKDGDDEVSNSKFIGNLILFEEAKLRWPKRY